VGHRDAAPGDGTSAAHRPRTAPKTSIFQPQTGSPDAVADDLLDAYLREGLLVTVRLRTADLVQMEVTGTQDQSDDGQPDLHGGGHAVLPSGGQRDYSA
jgi:hypothetical protein